MSVGCTQRSKTELPLCNAAEGGEVIDQTDKIMYVNDTIGLRIYTPNFSRIDLVCDIMPSPNDSTVIMCCEAAFTGKEIFKGGKVRPFEHRFIAGNHVSSGNLYKGYKCQANTGCFAYYPDSKSWQFAYDDYKSLLEKAEKFGGLAFGQTMIIFNGNDVHNGRPCKDSSKNEYRALCELDGKICIIDSNGTMKYGEFVRLLNAAGVRYALYLDMGRGWNYSFYRDNNGIARFIHNIKTAGTTNWITFYR